MSVNEDGARFQLMAEIHGMPIMVYHSARWAAESLTSEETPVETGKPLQIVYTRSSERTGAQKSPRGFQNV